MSKRYVTVLETYFKDELEDAAAGFEKDSLQALQSILVPLARLRADQKWRRQSFCYLIDTCFDARQVLAYNTRLSDAAGKYLFDGELGKDEVLGKMIENISALHALLKPASTKYYTPKLPPEYFPKLGEFTEKHLRAIQDKLNGKENTPPKDDRAVKVHDGALLRQPGLGDNSGNLTAGNSSSPGPAPSED